MLNIDCELLGATHKQYTFTINTEVKHPLYKLNFFPKTLLFLILDPLGNIPIFLSQLEKVENRYQVLARELLLALAILFLFLFFGKQMLDFLHLEQVSVSLAGAIILFIIALRMIFPASKQYGNEEAADEVPFIVPMAIPLVAGPSILATLILLASKHPDQFDVLAIALFIVNIK